MSWHPVPGLTLVTPWHIHHLHCYPDLISVLHTIIILSIILLILHLVDIFLVWDLLIASVLLQVIIPQKYFNNYFTSPISVKFKMADTELFQDIQGYFQDYQGYHLVQDSDLPLQKRIMSKMTQKLILNIKISGMNFTKLEQKWWSPNQDGKKLALVWNCVFYSLILLH